MIPTDEIVFIRAACRHKGHESPAVIVRGLHQDAPNPASEAHEAAAEVFPVSGFVQAGFYRVTGRNGFRYTFELVNWPDVKTAAFLRFPETTSDQVGKRGVSCPMDTSKSDKLRGRKAVRADFWGKAPTWARKAANKASRKAARRAYR